MRSISNPISSKSILLCRTAQIKGVLALEQNQGSLPNSDVELHALTPGISGIPVSQRILEIFGRGNLAYTITLLVNHEVSPVTNNS